MQIPNVLSSISFRRGRLNLLSALLAVALVASLPTAPLGANSADYVRSDSAVVVANRGSGDISVIDTESLAVHNVDLPGDAEPMYVSHDRKSSRVLVGDRAASALVVFDDETFDVVASLQVGDGVFHQWLDTNRGQVWVVGDTSQTVTVVDSGKLEVLSTIDIPSDLVAQGGKPHDVFVSGRHAFVTILGLDDGTGVVLQYSTRTFEETNRVTVGGDPHVFVRGARLFVASQGTSTVAVFRAHDLVPISSTTLPSAHGLFVTPRFEVLVTNIAGGGVDAIWELNGDLSVVRDRVDTSIPTPHNLTVDKDRQVFVTHSGATADQVSVVDLERTGFGEPTSVTVGLNPFGLAFVR